MQCENEKLRAVYEAAQNMLDDWDNDRTDVGSIDALEQALAAVEQSEAGECKHVEEVRATCPHCDTQSKGSPDASLADRLKRKGFEPITDAHCITCQKPINSQVDGMYCSLRCQAWSPDKLDDSEALTND